MKNVIRNDTKANAKGKWRAILKQHGLSDKELSGQHGPCPICAGKDRFRYTDYQDNGDYFCSGCGPGTGFDLLMHKLDCDFAFAAKEVDKLLGTDIEQVFKPKIDYDKRRRDLNAVWAGATDDLILAEYLMKRHIDAATVWLDDLRGHPSMFMAKSSDRHRGILALVRNKEGVPISVHRTYIDSDPKQRKMMPPIEKITGAAIRLGITGSHLIIGEGIETTLSGMLRYNCEYGYACISALGMETVILPEKVNEVTILADNDHSFTGQKAAFTLARRLDNDGLRVTVAMPLTAGKDFNDLGEHAYIQDWSNA
jgi:putative DNA primase/helicase